MAAIEEEWDVCGGWWWECGRYYLSIIVLSSLSTTNPNSRVCILHFDFRVMMTYFLSSHYCLTVKGLQPMV